MNKLVLNHIDTAPKDGTEILLFQYYGEELAHADLGAFEFIERSEFDGIPVYGWRTNQGHIDEPTHWLPKPVLKSTQVSEGIKPASSVPILAKLLGLTISEVMAVQPVKEKLTALGYTFSYDEWLGEDPGCVYKITSPVGLIHRGEGHTPDIAFASAVEQWAEVAALGSRIVDGSISEDV